jgi:hypothetical protein
VSRRRRIPRLHSIPGLTVFSISFRVSSFTFTLSLQRLVCPTTESAMDPEQARRHGRRPPRSSACRGPPGHAFDSRVFQRSNATKNALSRAP